MKSSKQSKAQLGGKVKSGSFNDDMKVTGEWLNKMYLAKHLSSIKQLKDMRKSRESMHAN